MNCTFNLLYFRGFNLPNLRPVSMYLPGQQPAAVRSVSSPTQSLDITSPRSTADSTVSLKSELGDLESPEKDKKSKIHRVDTCDKEQLTDAVEVKETSTGTSEYQPCRQACWFLASVQFLVKLFIC